MAGPGRRGPDQSAERRALERFTCERCGALPGEPCVSRSWREISNLAHTSRYLQLAAGQK